MHASGDQLVVTGLGDRDTGGGVFVLRDGRFQRIDWLSSTGLAVRPDGRRLARLLRDGGEDGSSGELLIYDERGVASYSRVDELSDPHDAVWHDGALVVASTSTNTLLWLDEAGHIQRQWTAPGEGDTCHLNCLLVVDGRLFACMFGPFLRHREWSLPGRAGGGSVFDVESGREVIGGLTCPHHPRRIDGRWLICDSHRHALVEIDDDGARRSLHLDGWTRGMAADGEHLYVGLSAQRQTGHEYTGSPPPPVTASVAVLDRMSKLEIDRLPLPCREVYDLIFVPAALVDGLERGFRTNALRAAEQDQYALFRSAGVAPVRLWGIADPLPAEACSVRVQLDLMGPFALGCSTIGRFRVENLGGALLTSAPPYPVSVSWRWFTPDGARLVEQGQRIPLSVTLPPAGVARGELRIPSPELAGEYLLRLSLVQEHVHWFDDLDPANGCSLRVQVRRAAEPEETHLANSLTGSLRPLAPAG